MSPLSVALPGASISFESTLAWPVQFDAQDIGDRVNNLETAVLRPPLARSTLTTGSLSSPPRFNGSSSTGDNVDNLVVRKGRLCAEMARNNAATGIRGEAIIPPLWQPAFDASGMNPGARVFPDAVVGVFDFHLSTLRNRPAHPNDAGPILFLPHNNQWNFASVVSDFGGTSGANVGGFGLVYNTDPGTGDGRYQHIAWEPGGNVIDRVDIPQTGVPGTFDFLDWRTNRYIIIGAQPGNPATLEFQLNGETVLTREFGTAQLLTPDQMVAPLGDPRAASIAPVYSIVGGGAFTPDTYWMQWYFKFGRFTPAGRELQGV